ncbi:MAG: SulP family inorganic anion transporter [Jaaginema sp. PMC 1079.18]|nr:SulP family inorganic anion transporter [Jaaginema sp. PMC 1080.18]MEC4849907.1 SulP family inorganic anion transporter [Jaaginema sp. PMC 1079.18]MEC4865980.1 SulP family inorganic anion transporter [Jaaginema sp. PMC 1078.18]
MINPATSELPVVDFAEEFVPKNLLASLMAGLVTGFIGVIRGISYAALIFSGSLAVHLNVGVGIAIYSTAAISIVVALGSSLPGMIATPLAAPTAVLAVMAAAIASQMVDSPPEVLLATVIAAIALGSLCTGLFLWLLGYLQLGKMVSFVPYPVVGGFMAGTGWLLIRGGMQVMTNVAFDLRHLRELATVLQVEHWLAGLAGAIALLFFTKRYQHYLMMPGILLSAIALFYSILWVTQTDVVTARAQGWLLGPFPQGDLWQPLQPSVWHNIDFSAIVSQIGAIATLMFISLLSLVLTNNGIELAIEREIDLNRELQAVGLANLLAGLGSGMAGNQALPSTILVHKMGANHRLAGVFKMIPCGAVLILGPAFLSLFPKPILGALLLYLGIDLLFQWAYKSFFKLPLTDYGMAMAIAVAINVWGFLQGVVLGLAMAMLLFTIKYSRIEATKNEFSGVNLRSSRERTAAEIQVLKARGEQIYILQLHGFIFFGRAHSLLEQVRQRLQTSQGSVPQFVILDFHLVSSLDSSAVLTLAKVQKLAKQRQVTVIWAGVGDELKPLLQQGEALDREAEVDKVFPDFNSSLAWCEDCILQQYPAAITPLTAAETTIRR